MAYSELIKNFDSIRAYMHEFYVYGFKNRSEFGVKSARSYDNERRRVESWLGEYMSFHQTENGKNCFLAVDSKKIEHNPLYKALKAKSFTAKDIMLHFYLLDMLSNGAKLGLKEITDRLYDAYLFNFEEPMNVDASTIRKKLAEYVKLGLLNTEKVGREILYFVAPAELDLAPLAAAVNFFAEAGQVGVVGSFLLDKYSENKSYLKFKHHYILHALESEVLLDILAALRQHQSIVINTKTTRGREISHRVFPIKLYVSTQNGRRYLFGWYFKAHKVISYRLDNIQSVTEPLDLPDYAQYQVQAETMLKNIWGVSMGKKDHGDVLKLDHVEMVIRVDQEEGYVVNCLNREKRCGRVEKLAEDEYLFVTDVHDAGEMLPWVRTFMGRIESFTSSNKAVEKRFWDDMHTLMQMYGVEEARHE